MAVIGFAALLKWDDGHKIFTRGLSLGRTDLPRERMCLVGDTLCYQTEPHHSKSMLINNVFVKNVLMCCRQKNERTKEGGVPGWTNKRNAFFNV